MKHIFKRSIIFIGIIAFTFIFLYFNNYIGVSRSKIESDARESQKIPECWEVAKDTSDKMSAMIFYNKNKNDCTFSIYKNHDGFHFGYFFIYGGVNYKISDGVLEFYINGENESVFMSMNKDKVKSIEIDDGNKVRRVNIDSTKPFVVILPSYEGNITLYNVDGKKINSIKETYG